MSRFIKNKPEELAAYIESLGRGLIVFDGRPLAGKSHLARTLAQRLGCTFVDADSFLDRKTGKFLAALRIDELRRAIEAGAPLVLLSSVCARQVIERLGLPVAAIVWIEHASLVRLDQMRRDFYDHDENADSIEEDPFYEEVEAYIASYDARRRPDVVVYFNAWS
jgi:adenylate kinase family enzyme